MKMGFLTPTLTPALFSAPLTAESCNRMKDLLMIKSGYLNSNFDFLYAICSLYIEHKQNMKAVDYARRLVNKYPQNPVGNQLLKAASQ